MALRTQHRDRDERAVIADMFVRGVRRKRSAVPLVQRNASSSAMYLSWPRLQNDPL